VILALALAIPITVLASQTWTGSGLSRRGTFTSGTETAPALADGGQDPTAGIDLRQATGIAGLNVFVTSTDDAGTSFSSGCVFQAYAWNATAAQWQHANDSDLQVQVQGSQAFLSLQVTTPQNRFVYVPVGCGVSSTLDFQGAAIRR
jgi:hypothetical protein